MAALKTQEHEDAARRLKKKLAKEAAEEEKKKMAALEADNAKEEYLEAQKAQRREEQKQQDQAVVMSRMGDIMQDLQASTQQVHHAAQVRAVIDGASVHVLNTMLTPPSTLTEETPKEETPSLFKSPPSGMETMSRPSMDLEAVTTETDNIAQKLSLDQYNQGTLDHLHAYQAAHEDGGLSALSSMALKSAMLQSNTPESKAPHPESKAPHSESKTATEAAPVDHLFEHGLVTEEDEEKMANNKKKNQRTSKPKAPVLSGVQLARLRIKSALGQIDEQNEEVANEAESRRFGGASTPQDVLRGTLAAEDARNEDLAESMEAEEASWVEA